MSEPATTGSERSVPGSVIAVAIGALALVLAYFAFGMPGMDHSTPTGEPEGYQLADVETFAALVDDDAALVLNVHVPFEGEIPGTDDHVASDRVAASAALPRNRTEPILVYCKTGSMSADAAEALVAEGYTGVRVLRGGMDAWAAAGRPLDGVD